MEVDKPSSSSATKSSSNSNDSTEKKVGPTTDFIDGFVFMAFNTAYEAEDERYKNIAFTQRSGDDNKANENAAMDTSSAPKKMAFKSQYKEDANPTTSGPMYYPGLNLSTSRPMFQQRHQRISRTVNHRFDDSLIELDPAGEGGADSDYDDEQYQKEKEARKKARGRPPKQRDSEGNILKDDRSSKNTVDTPERFALRQRLKATLERTGTTQIALAEIIGLKQKSYISRYMQNNITPSIESTIMPLILKWLDEKDPGGAKKLPANTTPMLAAAQTIKTPQQLGIANFPAPPPPPKSSANSSTTAPMIDDGQPSG
jgi:hypothetical protein